MKRICSVILLLGLITAGYSQSSVALLEEGNILVKQGSVIFDDSYFLKARGLFERIGQEDAKFNLAQYYIALSDYKLAVYYLQNENPELFKQYISSSQGILKSLLKKSDKDVESLALLGTVYGIQVSLDPNLGPTYGAQNVALVSKALGMSPDNPRVLLQVGISKFSTPEFYGGSKTEALNYFNKSVEIFESLDDDNLKDVDWGYLEALAWQGRTYEKLGEFEKALKSYQSALNVEPGYSWVKYVLMPALQEKMKSAKQ